MILRRYLQDESRRRGLRRAEARVAALTAEKETARDLAALNALASALAAKPGLLAALESSFSGAQAPAGVPKLRSAGIHLQDSTRLGQHELGDEAVVSGAYWVDGLDEGRVGRDRRDLLRRDVPRILGGRDDQREAPQRRAVHLRAPPDDRRDAPFALVAIVSAASGTVVAERAEVPVAPDYELGLKKEAAALQEAQSCDPKSAAAAYAALADLIADAAKVKPQYRALLDRRAAGARRRCRGRGCARQARRGDRRRARGTPSPAQCSFETARADAALALARKLPAGCDRLLPELFASRAEISRRAADQKWFLKTSAEARSRRRACDFAGAAERWTEALAVLEADPAARCGAAETEAKAAEAELPAVRRA